jgi:hypothetical protein
MDWIWANKEWLLAALGIVVAVIGWFIVVSKTKQVQKGGHHSTNIQVGRDIRINRGDRDD